MTDQRTRSLTILARLQAALGAGIAVIVFGLYGLVPNLLTDTTLSLTAAILGAFAAVYFGTLHQIFKFSKLALSTLALSIITGMNLVLVITSTGGLDSPFYAFWILAIVVAGIFGVVEIILVGSLTVGYYAYEIFHGGLHSQYLTDHLIEFGLTLAAAGLAQWVHIRTRNAAVATSKIAKLSGQLSTEQIKADAIVSSIGEGVMVVDSLRRIQVFNKAAQNLSGWDESSAQNIDYNLVLQLRTTDDQPLNDLNDPFNEAWRKQAEIVHDNLTTTTRSGHKIQLSLSISPLFDDHGAPSGAIALFRDISKEKEVERQKDEFVSTASHEMRTPVAAIEGYISLAMNANVATVDDRAKKYLGKAHDTIQHLGELFRDLLSVTKAEEGQLGGHIDAINLGELVQSTVDDMQFTIQKKNLTLVYQIGGQSGKAIAPLYYVAANPERLREVLMNLIDNAGKFTTEGGIKVTLEGNEKEATVGISDTGVGIAPEDIGHLFQKFYRIDNSATRTIGGTGLGLYLCRRVIELFNGRIWVESKVGEGSTFRFTLPRLTDAEITKIKLAATATTPGVTTPGVDSIAAPAAIPAPAAHPASSTSNRRIR
ncbi:MAG TPA: ATP-binding protein [Candidatus Saccharimonadia bacterium]|nr:ATP-binding protein [Candidatus Saccharimonadia bacterium]